MSSNAWVGPPGPLVRPGSATYVGPIMGDHVGSARPQTLRPGTRASAPVSRRPRDGTPSSSEGELRGEVWLPPGPIGVGNPLDAFAKLGFHFDNDGGTGYSFSITNPGTDDRVLFLVTTSHAADPATPAIPTITGSLTWTQQATIVYAGGTFNFRATVFTAVLSASAADPTITVTRGSAIAAHGDVFGGVGLDTTTPVVQTKSGSSLAPPLTLAFDNPFASQDNYAVAFTAAQGSEYIATLYHGPLWEQADSNAQLFAVNGAITLSLQTVDGSEGAILTNLLEVAAT